MIKKERKEKREKKIKKTEETEHEEKEGKGSFILRRARKHSEENPAIPVEALPTTNIPEIKETNGMIEQSNAPEIQESNEDIIPNSQSTVEAVPETKTEITIKELEVTEFKAAPEASVTKATENTEPINAGTQSPQLQDDNSPPLLKLNLDATNLLSDENIQAKLLSAREAEVRARQRLAKLREENEAAARRLKEIKDKFGRVMDT